jgi:NH3-dependent NAD+ synthetase
VSALRRLRLGLRDYMDKNKFLGVVLGLSGGIDSALCAAIAVDARGRRRCVLPQRARRWIFSTNPCLG